ncbi:MAG: hypothetical protein GWN61_10475, partial [candidate division Zixibacteria bacterium]|nr:hypothetical protein [candidate division Zixibacteria bacterium]NIV06583.1 hypothetical protein [candidate division Zixibacteria bacterium]NIW45408.1 hypothetical protein [Gammaproteobacteria bacterium]
MPNLTLLPDGRYGIIISLPAGQYIRYKYTQGDGFWNAEETMEGDFRLREIIVPDEPAVINDEIEAWAIGENAPITFDIAVPEDTPEDEYVSIQFNPYGWTEPLPMWHLGDTRWVYILYNPLDMVDAFGFRFCRMDQCGQTDDLRSMGDYTSGQVARPDTVQQTFQDTVESWAWLNASSNLGFLTSEGIIPQDESYIAGIETQTYYRPSWGPLMQNSMAKISATNANWVILTPSWSFTNINEPVLQQVGGYDPLWQETQSMIHTASINELNIALRPVPRFPTQIGEWWAVGTRDFSWWVTWFDRYEEFIYHHAALAEASGLEMLVLGGSEISPALPNGTLFDGSSSGVPEDADSR